MQRKPDLADKSARPLSKTTSYTSRISTYNVPLELNSRHAQSSYSRQPLKNYLSVILESLVKNDSSMTL